MLSPALTARAVAAAIDALAGTGTAAVNRSPDGAYVVTPAREQVQPLRALAEKAAAGKPTVSVQLAPVLGPMIIRRAAPWVLGGLVVTFFAGRWSGRRR